MKRCASSSCRRDFRPLAALVLVALFVVPNAAPSLCEEPPGNSSISPSDACHEIHSSLKRLAQAERDQALALVLYSYSVQPAKAKTRAGRPPAASPAAALTPRAAMVETRFHRMRERTAELREVLRRVHASRIAHDEQVAECLQLGYDAVFGADNVSADVERVLIVARSGPA